MKKKYLIYTMLPVMALAVLGAGLVSANGLWGGLGNITPDEIANRQQTMFQDQAQVLGISAEEVKDAWAEGKTIKQIMEEKGISQEQVQARMKELRTQQMKSYLQTLVDKEVISQTQADKRLQVMQSRLDNGKMGRGFHGGFGRGFNW